MRLLLAYRYDAAINDTTKAKALMAANNAADWIVDVEKLIFL